MRLPESGWGAAGSRPSTRPSTPSAAASLPSRPSRPSTAPGLRSRPASRGAPSVAPGTGLERPGTAGPATKEKKKPTKMFTYRRAYPLPRTPPPGKPQSAEVVARLARAEKKRQELTSLYVDRDPARAAAGQEAPPWWSEKVHGKTGESLMESQLGPKSKPAEDEPLNVRSSLEVLRSSLGTLPWSDGRPVLDPNRRMRVEVSEVEEEMREHLWRYCTAVRKKYKSPCISEYQYLTKVFSDYDKAKMPKLEGQAKVETTGDVSVREFLDIWNDEIRLYRRQKLRDPESGILVCAKIVTDENGKEVFERAGRGEEVLLPFKLTEAHGAAIFCKYGYNKDGLMPYDVFCRSIFTPPARKLGMEPLLNNKAKGLDGFGPKDDPGFDGKIIYSKSRKGVFSPTDFDPLLALRSSKAPTASMQLDWVHGYAGVKNVANNLYYNAEGDVVYYTAAVCIVYSIERHEQRHFFGHNEEIACLGAHPGKELFASGQWKAAGPTEVPYVCIWDSTTMQEVQRIGHPRDNRGVIALAFSPGEGRHLITCTGDNQHTLFVWDWNAKPRDRSKPASWHYGPLAKLATLQESPTGFFFQSAVPPCPPSRAPGAPAPGELRPGRFKPGTEAPELGVAYSTQHHGITALQGWDYRRGKKVTEASATASGNLLNKDGLKARKLSQMFFDPKNKEAWKVGDGSYELLCEPMNAVNGLPPALFGIVFNHLDAGEMCEFVTYGVKHIKWWRWHAEAGTYVPENGVFGAANVSNILSAAFVRDSMGGSVIDPDTGKRITFREQVKDKETGRMLNKGICKVTESGKIVKYLRDKKDNVVGEKYIADMPGGAQWKDRVTSTVLVTGFITGNLGVWLRNHKTPFQPQLMRVVRAHKPGPQIVLADGSISFGGVRCLKIRSDEKTLISAGADGAVHQWDVKQYVDDAPWMTAVGAQTSVSDKRPTKKGEVNKALLARGAVRLKKLDGLSHKVESVYKNEAGPMFRGLDCMPGSHVFVAGTNRCDIWEVDETPRVLVYGHMAEVYSLAIHPTDPDKYASCCLSTRIFVWSVAQKTMTRTADVGLMCKEIAFSRCGQHLALGGKHGRVKIVNAETLQPLESFKYCETAIDEIKYSPNNRIMAAGSHDLVIDIYDTGMRADGKGKAKYGKVARYPEVNCVYGDEAVYKKAGYKGGYQRIARCQGHSATIKHLDFSLPLFDPPELRGKTILQSNCNSKEILYFDSKTGAKINMNQRDAKWDTWTCSLGFSVMGIWGDGEENMDINAVTRSHSQEYCIVSNDFSTVKLFNYPCVVDNAPHRVYHGHASHVTKARWSNDDRFVFTCGSGDRAILQWKTHGVNKTDCLEPSHDPRTGELLPYLKPNECASCDVDMCCFCGRMEKAKDKPPEWGPIDAEGKFWGPIGK